MLWPSKVEISKMEKCRITTRKCSLLNIAVQNGQMLTCMVKIMEYVCVVNPQYEGKWGYGKM